MRILILSHGHPDLSAGGAERAAYSLFQRLKRDPAVTRAVFVAAADRHAIGHDADFGSFRGRSDEILAAPPPVDGFTFQSLGYDALKRLVDELVRTIKPDLVHVHHFIFWGLDVFELFQKAGVRVVFTFHEYAAVCANFGQMVKSDGRLCHASSPAECGMCLPSLGAGKFFIRDTIVRTLLGFVDRCISPSRFLKARLVAWGIADERVAVVENLLSSDLLYQYHARGRSGPVRSRPDLAEGAPKMVFGFFGQVTPFKGVDTLLEAAALLPDHVRQRMTIRLYGENRHYTDTEFHERTQALLRDVRGVVSPMGGYRGDDVLDLMSSCDMIIVPSVWWENSPVVIQEARLAARPVICSNIGGMAEKADPTVDYVFPARSPGALANLIVEIVDNPIKPNPERLKSLAQRRADADEAHFVQHLVLYRAALDRDRAVMPIGA